MSNFQCVLNQYVCEFVSKISFSPSSSASLLLSVSSLLTALSPFSVVAGVVAAAAIGAAVVVVRK